MAEGGGAMMGSNALTCIINLGSQRDASPIPTT